MGAPTKICIVCNWNNRYCIMVFVLGKFYSLDSVWWVTTIVYALEK